MKIKQLKISKLVTPLVRAALLIPAISSGFPTDTDTYRVTAVRVGPFTFEGQPGNDPASNPSDPKWASATVTNVPLEYIVFASGNAKGGFDDWAKVGPESVRHLSVKSIHDGEEILFRVEYEDETFDDPTDAELYHAGPGGYMVDLLPGESYPTVWANWDGDRNERNGSKFIGLWGILIIAP